MTKIKAHSNRIFRTLQKISALCLIGMFFVGTLQTARGEEVMISASVLTMLRMSVDTESINLGGVIPGLPKTGTTSIEVTTNAEHGYQLHAYHSSPGQTDTLRHSNEIDYIIDKVDYDGTENTTNEWSGTGFGFTIYSGTFKNTGTWGTGTTESDSRNRYSGIPDSNFPVYSASSNVTNDEVKVGYKVNISSIQKEGTYSGDITYSAIIVP